MYGVGMDDTHVKIRGAPVLDEPALSAHQKMIADKLTVAELMSMAVVALPPVVLVIPICSILLVPFLFRSVYVGVAMMYRRVTHSSFLGCVCGKSGSHWLCNKYRIPVLDYIHMQEMGIVCHRRSQPGNC